MIKENRRKNLESVGGGVLCGGGRAEHEGGNVQFLSRSTTYEVLERERTQRGCVSGFGWVSWVLGCQNFHEQGIGIHCRR